MSHVEYGWLIHDQTKKYCLANIWSFACQAQCVTAWLLHNLLLDKNFWLVTIQKCFWTLTSKCACQTMSGVVAKLLTHACLTSKIQNVCGIRILRLAWVLHLLLKNLTFHHLLRAEKMPKYLLNNDNDKGSILFPFDGHSPLPFYFRLLTTYRNKKSASSTVVWCISLLSYYRNSRRNWIVKLTWSPS